MTARQRGRKITQAASVEALSARLKNRQRKGGPPARREASRIMLAVVRRNEALKLKLKYASYRQIGQQLGVSNVQAREDVLRAAGEIELDTARHAEKYRAIEAARLDEASLAMVPLMHGQVPAKEMLIGHGKRARRVVTPNDPVDVARVQTAAVQRITHLSARRSALLGLDAPIKITPTDPTGTRRYHDLTEEELERLLAQKTALLGRSRALIVGDNGDGQDRKS